MAGKRGNGEGNISRRADGRWQARYTVKDDTGKSQRKYIYGKTRKYVADELTRVLGDIHRGSYIPNSSQTLADFLDYWLRDCKECGIRHGTYLAYDLIRRHAVSYFPTTQLQKLTAQHIEAYKNAKLQKLAAGTVHVHITILKAALEKAVKWGFLQRNPAAYVSKPKITRFKGTFLTPENALLLMEVVKGSTYEIAILIALGTGLRRGEICGLHWGDIDFAKGVLVVRTIQTKEDKKALFSLPKSESGKRALKMPQFVIDALQAHREAQEAQCTLATARGRWEENNLVICSRWGKPIIPNAINRSLNLILAKSNMPAMRVHDLRHSFASLMEGQGVSLKTVSTMLGHSSIAITADLYVHTSDKSIENAADLMDNLLGKKLIGGGLVSATPTEGENNEHEY